MASCEAETTKESIKTKLEAEIVSLSVFSKLLKAFFFFPIYLLIITLTNYSYNTTEKKKKQNTLTIDINRVKQD